MSLSNPSYVCIDCTHGTHKILVPLGAKAERVFCICPCHNAKQRIEETYSGASLSADVLELERWYKDFGSK